MFQQALQAATIEAGKPKEMRMDWNHNEPPATKMISPSGRISPEKRKRLRNSEGTLSPSDRKRRGFEFLPTTQEKSKPQLASTANLTASIEKLVTASKVEGTKDLQSEELCCKLFEIANSNFVQRKHIGFVMLRHRESCTLSDARIHLQEALVPDHLHTLHRWRFVHPTLGSVSAKQESSLGPLLPLLQPASSGDGSQLRPLSLYIEYTP